MVDILLYLSQLSDLFRQASNFRVGDTARVLVGHIVHQRINLSGQVPLKEHETPTEKTSTCVCFFLYDIAFLYFSADIYVEESNSKQHSWHQKQHFYGRCIYLQRLTVKRVHRIHFDNPNKDSDDIKIISL